MRLIVDSSSINARPSFLNPTNSFTLTIRPFHEFSSSWMEILWGSLSKDTNSLTCENVSPYLPVYLLAFPSFSGIKQRRVQNPQESHRRQTMNSQIAIALKYVRKHTHVRNSGTNGRRSNPCLVSKNSLWVPLIHHHHHHSSHGFPVPSNLKHFAMGPLKIFVGTSLWNSLIISIVCIQFVWFVSKPPLLYPHSHSEYYLAVPSQPDFDSI